MARRRALILLIALPSLPVVVSLATSVLVQCRIRDLRTRGEPVSLADLGANSGGGVENAAGIYRAAFLSLHGHPCVEDELLSCYAVTGDYAESAARGLERNRAALDLAVAALGRSTCSFPLDDGAIREAIADRCRDVRGTWDQRSLSEYSRPMVEIARDLSIRARLRARSGRIEDAIVDLRAAARCAWALEGEPPPDSLRTGIYIATCVLAAVRSLRDEGHVTGVAETDSLLGILESLDRRRALVEAVRIERAAFLDVSSTLAPSDLEIDDHIVRFRVLYEFGIEWNLDVLFCLDRMEGMIESAGPSLADEIPRHYVLSQRMLPPLAALVQDELTFRRELEDTMARIRTGGPP